MISSPSSAGCGASRLHGAHASPKWTAHQASRLSWPRNFGQQSELYPGSEERVADRERRNFTAAVKAKVALEARRGDWTPQAIAAKRQLRPERLNQWKRAPWGANAPFEDKRGPEADHGV